jgi:hypothetical protein
MKYHIDPHAIFEVDLGASHPTRREMVMTRDRKNIRENFMRLSGMMKSDPQGTVVEERGARPDNRTFSCKSDL